MVCYHPLIAVDVTLGKQSTKVIQVIGSAEQNPALYAKAQKDEHCYILPCGRYLPASPDNRRDHRTYP